ncbi:dihydrofolate reductase family protein [Sphaerisporangium corydalis]|uniref:Dihydrofolate reductase family protein n=1 Tax=Sphaerisporangium corydalis TaxID=1441875 RepID=A0ABV9EIY3_9ACTN|nr:dihydrofolate reductase family protein [Sphaerisporangium corydalis]
MRKVIVSLFATLDGYATGPNETMNWVTDNFGEDTAKYAHDQLFASDLLILGRVTYDIMAGSWPTMSDDVGFADRMNGLPKVVFSRTLKEPLSWNNATVAEHEVSEEIRRLRKEPGQDILVYGSLSIVRELMRLGLVDRFRLWLHPVTLGDSGLSPIFDGYDTGDLKLMDSTVLSSGVVILDYEPVTTAG